MNQNSTWTILINSLMSQRVSPSTFDGFIHGGRSVTRKMRENCRRIRLETAEKQRKAKESAFISVINKDERLMMEQICERAGVKPGMTARDRLNKMADAGMLVRTIENRPRKMVFFSLPEQAE